MPNLSNTSSKIKYCLFALFMLAFIEPVFAQHWFNKTFNIYDDSARQVQHIGTDFVQKHDGNIIALSISNNRNEYDTLTYLKSKIQLSILNKSGIKLDSANYFFKGNLFSANFLLSYDSTIFFIGGNILNYKEYEDNTNGYDPMLIRINENGDTLWTKKYRIDDGNEYVNEIVKCSDGNILLYGSKCTYQNTKTFCDLYLLKVDTNGNEIFRKIYSHSNSSYEYAGGLAVTDSGIILFAATDTIGYSIKPFLLFLDNDGNIIKRKTFFNLETPIDAFLSRELILNTDGSMLLISQTIFDSAFLFNTYLIKLDHDLNIQWYRIIDGSYNDVKSVMKFNNKYMMVGYKHDERTNRYFAMVTVYRENGNKVFERTYGIPNSNFRDGNMKSLHYVSDSTIWVIGDATIGLAPNNFQRTWIMTIDTFGCLSPGCAILGINDVPFTIEPLLVFPNPANEYIQLSHSVEIQSYRIFDASARLLKSGIYENNKIDISELPQGLFYIHVMLKDGTQTTAKSSKF